MYIVYFNQLLHIIVSQQTLLFPESLPPIFRPVFMCVPTAFKWGYFHEYGWQLIGLSKSNLSVATTLRNLTSHSLATSNYL